MLIPADMGKLQRDKGSAALTAARDGVTSFDADVPVEDIPGYRRVICVVPARNAVAAMLEDDMHCLAVTLRHDGEVVRSTETMIERLPWDTCPGAAAKLEATFAGHPLAEVTARREKKQNCTHMHDMAVLAAAHAHDASELRYDLYASDPVEGTRILEVRRNAAPIHRWIERDGILIGPEAVAGRTLLTLRDWIASLNGVAQEAARLLQWAALVAHGRTIPLAEQSRAADLPPNCYTFQPERAAHAQRVGDRLDFSDGSRVPLAAIDDKVRATLR